MQPIRTRARESTTHPRRVRTDLILSGVLLGVVVLGNMLWHTSDAGILTVLGR